MANISLILLVAVLTIPSVLMSKVSNQTRRMIKATKKIDPTFTVTDCPGANDDVKKNEFLKYFIGKQMPSGLFELNDQSVVYLCQKYPPKFPEFSYYSTIFDKTTMNAILSAYYVTQEEALLIGENSRSGDYWISQHESPSPGNLYSKKEYDALYKSDSNYHKGHLLPVSIYSFDQSYLESTFDYSNAVPQHAEWNRKDWQSSERAIKRYTQLTCGCKYRGQMYLLTGTSQFTYNGNDVTKKLPRLDNKIAPNTGGMDIEGRPSIRIPNVMWTAGCCIGLDPLNGKEKVQSIAVIGNNLPANTLTRSTTVHRLQLMLADGDLQKSVILFPGQPACSDPGKSYDLKFKVES